MITPTDGFQRSYDELYAHFDSPLAKQMRREIYGSDLGQHSWVRAGELENAARLLGLTGTSRLLDLGCGPGGPLTFVVGLTGCHGTGLDLSAHAIASAADRARALRLDGRIALMTADLDEPLTMPGRSFDAAMSLDVVIHLRNRAQSFAEIARVLVPGGRFAFTDAGVVTGAVTDEEIRLRSLHGRTHFAPPGFNERMLELSGLRLLERVDCTASLLAVAGQRLEARLSHRAQLEASEGVEGFERYQRYLATVCALARRKAVARVMYLVQSRTTTA